MSEQVQCMSAKDWAERAPTRRMVLEDEYDALRTQVAELRAENEAHLEKIGELGAAGFFDRVGITDQLCDERNALLDENQALRDQLEAARRGTSEAIDLIDCISRHPSNRIPVLDQARGALVKVLTATPAPEVQCKACNDTACDQSHEELVPCPGCAAKPAHVDGFHGDDTALVSSAKALLALDEKGALAGGGIGGHARTIIGAFIARMAEQGERQEAQVMWRVHHNPDHPEPVRAVLNSIGRQLPDNAPLYAEPQPDPDVRGLVEALEQIADARETPTLGDPNVLRAIAFQALAAHRQAQRKGEGHG